MNKSRRNILIICLLSLILCTPFIYSFELYNGIFNAKQIWFNCSIGLLIFTFGIYGVFYKKSIFYCLNAIDFSLLTFYTYITLRSIFDQYTPALYNTRFLNYTLLLVFYFIVKITFYKTTKRENEDSTYNLLKIKLEERQNILSATKWFLSLVLILTGLIEAIWGLLQLYKILPSFHPYFNITGTFYNPAPYALYLAVIFPFALGLYLYLQNDKMYNKILKYLSLITVLFILLILPAARIRTSWVSVTFGTILVCWPLFKKNKQIISILQYINSKIISKIIISIVTIILLLFLGIGLFKYKEGSSFGKLFIWEVSTQIVKQHPFTGIGVGRFKAEYNQYQAEWFKVHPIEMDGKKGMVGGDTKYAFNEYLEILTETGIIGLFLFILIIISVIIQYIKDTSRFFISRLFFAIFIVLLVSAFFSFPFYSLPTFIIFFFVMGAISGLTPSIEFDKQNNYLKIISIYINHNLIRKFAGFTMVALSFLLLFFTYNQYRAYYYWNQSNMVNEKGIYDTSYAYTMASHFLRYDGEFLLNYGVYLIQNKQYEKGFTFLENSKFYISNENLYTSIGDSYRIVGNFKKAEQAYIQALYYSPQRFYPLYILAKFYEETKQIDKAIILAQRIVDKNPKVNYDEINKFKQEMNNLIRNYKQSKISLTTQNTHSIIKKTN